MLNNYSLKMPRAVYSGEHSLEQMKIVIPERVRKVAVFTDREIIKAGLLTRPLEILKEMGKEIGVLDQLAPEPTYAQAQQVVDAFRESGADYIMAVGGGSVMDMAKLASVLGDEKLTVKELLEHPEKGVKWVDTLMIPTTAGTGAEATPNSIVSVPEQELKVGIVNPQMIADVVILDERMTEKLPRHIAAATGVDALAHAIECYTSQKANPFSDTFALEALDMIMNHIERVCDHPEDAAARRAMLTGAFYAGLAITASGTTAVHALSYPLGGKYHIPHGVSNAMLLVPVMRFNKPACVDRLAVVYDRIAHKDGSYTKEEKADWVIDRIGEIVNHLDIPCSLKQYGVCAEDLDTLVEAGMKVQRLLSNNLRPVTAEDARALYLEILGDC